TAAVAPAPATATATATAIPDVPRADAAPPLSAADRERLLAGTHDDPHAHLGPHALPDGTVRFRALRPRAVSVGVLVRDGAQELRTELLDEGGGFFAGTVPEAAVPPPPGVPAYELLVRYGDGSGGDGVRVVDPYGFPSALGELDLRLFAEGRHETLWRALGARTMTQRGVSGTRFTVWAPNARGVRVTGDFNRWDGTAYPMRALGTSGVWELFVPGVGDGARYTFEVVREDDSRVLRADPMARAAETPDTGASVVHTSGYRWRDGDWLDRRAAGNPLAAPLSVYEIHLPSWRPGATYRELAAELPAYVRDMGFTHVELMPWDEHPCGSARARRRTGLFTPPARLGDPDDFRHLVDTLHRAGVGVLLGWAPGHFPDDERGLAHFDGPALYERPAPDQPSQPGQHSQQGQHGPERPEFDYGRPAVRNYLVAAAVHWCEEFHVDGLRVDDVATMLRTEGSCEPGARTADSRAGQGNRDAVALLQQMNATLHRRCPGVITAAVDSASWDGVTRATDHEGESGFGGLGFDFKWNTDWTHDTLGYLRLAPAERARCDGLLTRAMARGYAESFLLPVPHHEAAHGTVRTNGRTSATAEGGPSSRLADLRAVLGFMWAHPGKQLLAMGQEFAQETAWSEELGPDWRLLEPSTPGSDGHRGVRDLVRDLNSRYVRTPSLWQLDADPAGFRWVEDGGSRPADADARGVFALLRFDASGAPLLAVSNFSPVTVRSYRLGVPRTGFGTGTGTGWREVLNTDDARYGGSGTGNPGVLVPSEHPAHGLPVSVTPVLPARATLWLRPD
ncbi:1,4-alpha-glucan branching enzyme, partial [Streptomyces nanshensis]|uniref:1,4-alpha-glucan branching enzyme n=1 Tax=Streptomyces nanshensis TaxID=518642 RepID=UPI000A9702BF